MFFSGKIFSLRWLTSFYNLGSNLHEGKVGRKEWQTKVKSYSQMISDENKFYLENTLWAFENEKEIFKKIWKKEIPRDFN